MAKRQVFYSFHYKKDVTRAAQIRNIGAIEGNKSVAENDWENIKTKGSDAVKQWIDDNMNYRSCVIVLVGEETSERPWVKYEIEKAWKDGKGLFGIYINNIKNLQSEKGVKGTNPFSLIKDKETGEYLSKYVNCYTPSPDDAYNDIAENIEDWVEKAIKDRE